MSAAWQNSVQSLQSLPINAKTIRYPAIAFVLLTSLILLYNIGHTSTGNWPSVYSSQTKSTLSGLSDGRQKSLESILNSTLGFEKILALSLPERTDHRDGLVLASAVSGFHIDFVDGVHGDTVLDKTLPPEHAADFNNAVKGSWRAHVNALQRIVDNGWSSALIFEDDVDWDIRLKAQLQNFALASDYVLRHRNKAGFVHLKNVNSHPLPTMSPYGDDWDILWLGHCGMDFPGDDPKFTVMLQDDDETVAEVPYLHSWEANAISPLARFANHTRAVMPSQGTCSLAYAVSQKGARQLLYSLGLQKFDAAVDVMLRFWCEGSNGRGAPHVCLGVLPQLFDHHRRKGPVAADSDISGAGGDVRERAYTANIRWSVRLNMEKLLRGDKDYEDQYPDVA